jgi:hypothetical protein
MIAGVTSFVQPQSRIIISPQNRNRSTLCASKEIIPTANNDSEENEEVLTPEGIAELIEVSFLQSCLQLSQGYIDVLKLFIVAVKAGYERSIPLSELNQLVEDCPVNSAGRDLMAEEKALRAEWMKVVYELLNALNSSPIIDSSCVIIDDNEVINKRVSQVVESMVTIKSDLQTEETNSGGEKDAKVALSNLTVEQAIDASSILSQLQESTSDLMGTAFLTNDIRVALIAFRVLQEEELCMEGSSGNTKDVPRPPIPGT